MQRVAGEGGARERALSRRRRDRRGQSEKQAPVARSDQFDAIGGAVIEDLSDAALDRQRAFGTGRARGRSAIFSGRRLAGRATPIQSCDQRAAR